MVTTELPLWLSHTLSPSPVHPRCDPFSPSLSWQEEVARLAALQPQVDLLEKRLKELKEEKEGEEDPSTILDADIDAFKEHYHQVLEDLRARERQLHLGERGEMLIHCKNIFTPPRDPWFCLGALNFRSWWVKFVSLCYILKMFRKENTLII